MRPLGPRVVVDVVEHSVERERHDRVRTERYRKSAVMRVPIGPLGATAASAVWEDTILQPRVGDDGDFGHGLRHRGRRRPAVARVRLPRMHLCRPKGFAQPVDDSRHLKVRVRVRGSITATVVDRVIDKPSPQVECVIGGVQEELYIAGGRCVPRNIGLRIRRANVCWHAVSTQDGKLIPAHA